MANMISFQSPIDAKLWLHYLKKNGRGPGSAIDSAPPYPSRLHFTREGSELAYAQNLSLRLDNGPHYWRLAGKAEM